MTPAEERIDHEAEFARWRMESQLWSGSDYLWLNRFRTLHDAYLALLSEHSAREEALNELNEIIEAAAGKTISPSTARDLQNVFAALPATEPAQPEEERPRLVYCARCHKEHAVMPADTPCAPGAWSDVLAEGADPGVR